MTLKGSFAVLLVAVPLLLARPATAQRFMFTGAPDAQVLAFLQRLQQAVSAGNRGAVAGMVNYPLRVNHDAAKHTMIASAAVLLKQYDAVFTPAIRQAIVTETPDRLTGGRDGAAIKGGLVWISGVCDESHPPKCRLGVASVNLHDGK